ncbi:MAG: glycoside hydrolase family 92 protein, partial [Saprospiraceae bacterium]|nr:glycoside hydrolase family 92 protein [Saprospiraceae bacterium]
PAEAEAESVSKTLEYAYDDWCIAQMAKALGRSDDYLTYLRRAQYYKNLFDPSTGFFRARMNQQWVEPFDPSEVNFHFTEANAWQYAFYAP